jgi:serine/alanine adding enzyme
LKEKENIKTLEIRRCTSGDQRAWDAYIERHPEGSFYHLCGWRRIIKASYGHEPFYLIAEKKTGTRSIAHAQAGRPENVVGVLPLFLVKPPLWTGSLVSLPFLDFAGVLADTHEAASALVKAATEIGIEGKAHRIELRSAAKPVGGRERNVLDSFGPLDAERQKGSIDSRGIESKSHKVRMLLELPDSSNSLMVSFKSKLRSQIKKPIKEGLQKRIGGAELMDDFYAVFSKNMRDLGSPVHSRDFIRHVVEYFRDKAKIFIVYKGSKPAAGSILLAHGKTITNPWASALQEYKHLSPNMLLYWAMLEYACDNGFALFDFGRSSPGSGTFRFKQQWGARAHPLLWQYIYVNGAPGKSEGMTDSLLAEAAVKLWQKLPVTVTTRLGPPIRKYITL